MPSKRAFAGRGNIHRALLVALALLGARPAHADAERQAAARQHFEAGYRLVQEGALDAAIEEFELAYRQSPHFSVLYNLGQAYATLGRSVEAVDRLERYLALGGARIDEARAQQVRELIAYHARRIGDLALEVRPAGARVLIDGTPLEAAALSGPIRLNAGVHALVAEHAGHATAATSVRVEPGRTARVVLELAATPLVPVFVSCPIPDVMLSVDGARPARLAPGRVLLSPGEHQLGFRRAGYLPRDHAIVAEPGHTYSCALEVDQAWTGLGKLRVRHPERTVALIDGSPHAARPIPEGRHRVSVSGPGYEAAEKWVTLAPRQTLTLDLMPSRSAAVLLLEERERERQRKLAGFIVGGVGLAALAGAGALYLYNSGEYDDWGAENASLLARFRADPASVSRSEFDALFDEENRIRNRDIVTTGMAVFGLTSLAAGAVLLLWPSKQKDTPKVTGVLDGARIRF